MLIVPSKLARPIFGDEGCLIFHCTRPTKAGLSRLSGWSGWSGWSDRKFIKKNQTDQKDQPTRQTNPGALREHRKSPDLLSFSSIPFQSIERSGHGCLRLRASNEHIPIVRVLRARKAPGHSGPLPSCFKRIAGPPQNSPTHTYLLAGFNGWRFSLKEILHDFST